MSNLTKFEKEVLEEVKKIPTGKVIIYQDVAKKIGNPKAVRAVGNALNKNPNAPNIPCHRVVRSDGSMGGYKGGFKKKIALLKKEGIKIKQGKIVNFTNATFKL